jgi:hypothetical protein
LRKIGTSRGKKSSTVRRYDENLQRVVSDQRVLQLLRKRVQVPLRMDFLKSMLGQFQLAREYFHVLLFKMFLDRTADQESK